MKREEQISEILLMPICCKKKHKKIKKEDGIIQSGQKYYSSADGDMSDFAIGFYEIIYKEILESKAILKHNGYLYSRNFAGDTMNSFHTIANITPGAGKSRKEREDICEEKWPKYLRDYYSTYHCLANFWLIPMKMGRTTAGEYNKARRPISDYMDRYLQMLYSEIDFEKRDRDYFKYFESKNDFAHKHFLIGVYIDINLNIDLYSKSHKKASEFLVEKAMEKMRLRADSIAKSKYADELWDYFKMYELV